MNPEVFTQIRTHSYIRISARSVVTTRLSLDVGIDALTTIMNFIIISGGNQIAKNTKNSKNSKKKATQKHCTYTGNIILVI
jgi:hypothetical protein